MRYALGKLWSAFFVAVLLFVVALVAGTLVKMANPGCFSCGSNVALTLWIMGVAVHQPVLWVQNLSFIRRLGIWLTAFAVGFVTYLGAEALATSLLASGYGWRALQLGVAANVIGVMVAPVVSLVLVRRSCRRGQVASASAATRPSTQDRERQISVRPTQAPDRQGAPRTTNRMLREVSWFVGCAAVVGAFVVIVMGTDAQERWPTVTEWTTMVLFTFGVVTAVRVAAWLIRGGGRRFRY